MSAATLQADELRRASASMISANAQEDIVQQAGELACLMAQACELSRQADEGDNSVIWDLRALLSATKLYADALHDACGQWRDGASA